MTQPDRYPVLVAHGDSEVRLYEKPETYTYLVYVTPGHAEKFCEAMNRAFDSLRAPK